MKTVKSIFFLLLVASSLIAQERNRVSQIETDTSEVVREYRELGGVMLGLISIRDFATSPLIYRGPSLGFKNAKTKSFNNKENKFATIFSLSTASSSVGDETNTGFVMSADFSFSKLYTLKRLNFKGWESKIGGVVDVLFVTRFNSNFRNNSLGFEFFPTLFGSFKIGKDYSRHLLFRKRRGLRKQHFSFRIDVGLINTNFRNGYAYTPHFPFYNGSNIFENYQFNWFSGMRLRSTIDYVLYAKNTKNAIKISYTWDGVRSGENPDRFALSHGLASFSYLYHLDNR